MKEFLPLEIVRRNGGLTPEQGALLLGLLGLVGIVGLQKLIASNKISFPALPSFRRNKKRDGGIHLSSVFIPDSARLRHTHIIGPTGTGKSVCLEQMMIQDIMRGLGMVIIDPKGDRSLYERVRRAAIDAGRETDLHLLSAQRLEESVRWNPCRIGNAAELQAKFLNANDWSEEYYRKATEAALIFAFNKLTAEFKGEGFTVRELGQALEEFSKHQRQNSATKSDPIQGLVFDMFSLFEGPWSEILCAAPQAKTKSEITLLDIVRKREILFVDLPTQNQEKQSKRLGRILLQELVLISGLKQAYPKVYDGEIPFSVYIDEFDSFGTEQFATFLNKGRASSFMIHMAHQALGDLDKISDAFMGQILSNPNVRIIFRQDQPDDCDYWAKFFGTKTTTKMTYQTAEGSQTGRGSQRAVQEFNFHPDELKSFQIGECILSIKSPAVQRKIKIPLAAQTKISRPEIRSENIPLRGGSDAFSENNKEYVMETRQLLKGNVK